MKLLAIFVCFGILSGGQNPNLRSWVLTSSTNASVRVIAPEVHRVTSDDNFVYVESAGLSLHSFGPLEANQYDPPAGPRALTFRIPRRAEPAVTHESAPLGIIGVFATGVPVYNPIGTASYNDQDLWHSDAVASSPSPASPLLESLSTDTGRHSPIIGFALDGYPIYGPFAFDQPGKVQRMKSSYRLRAITRRETLPDGTVLTPAQEGPAVNAVFPLGSFAEDYIYAPGSGDLDEFNGKFVTTPEYPDGTYAYFLTRTWPYLIGPRYYGKAAFDTPARAKVIHSRNVDLWTDRAEIESGKPVHFTLEFHTAGGHPVRFLEKVHQKPIHLIVVSKDLAAFAHIHPEPASADSFTVSHTFPHPGEYWLYADYTAPGEPPSIARFALTVAGNPRPPEAQSSVDLGGVKIAFTPPEHFETGQDIPLSFTLTNSINGQPIADLDPYLGAWAHIMMVSADGEQFIHAHPLENLATETNVAHNHNTTLAGPSPSTIGTVTGFRKPGQYKLWFQFQRHGVLLTTSWSFTVDECGSACNQLSERLTGPANTISVKVSASGFEPSRIEIRAGHETHLAFTRSDAQNCAREVVFPELHIRKPLPTAQTVIVDLPAQAAGELRFSCGMGMFRGAVVAR